MAELNSTILDAVYLNGTNDYQQRVPATDQGRIDGTMKALFDPMNSDLWNQFTDNLIKRIGMVRVHNQSFKNPLATFKGSAMEYGSTIEEVAVKWIKGHSYSFDKTKLLDPARPETQTWFHSVNRADTYPIDVSKVELRKSFTDDYGLSNYVASVLTQPINADEKDEYEIMKNLMALYENNWGFFKVELSADPMTSAGALDLMTKIRAYSGKLKFPSQLYNAGNVDIPVFVNDPKDLVCFITPDTEAYMDVQVLSSLFHVEMADIDTRRFIIDEFPMDHAVCLLTTKDFFVSHDTVKEMDSFYDPSTMCTKYYYQRQGIYSVSPFVPAILFTFGDTSSSVPTIAQNVTGFSLGDETATVEIGGTYTFTPKLIGTISPENDNFSVKPDACSYVIGAASTDMVLNSKTYVDADNVLHVQKTNVKSGSTFKVIGVASYVNPSGESVEKTAIVSFTVE